MVLKKLYKATIVFQERVSADLQYFGNFWQHNVLYTYFFYKNNFIRTRGLFLLKI